jgi:tetratricopeptide (TPR) repeat protein
VFGELNKYGSAEKTLKGVLSRQKELLGEEHTETQLTQHYYGRVLWRQSKWTEAYAVYEPLWQLRKENLDQNSTADLAIRTGHELGRILNEIDRFGEAAEILEIIHPAAKTVRGQMDKVTLSSGVELGKALRCTERQQDAKILLDEVHELCQQSPTELDHFSIKCTHELAMLSCHAKNFEEAEKLARVAWVARTAAKASADIGTLDSAECLSRALYGLGRVEEAWELLEDVYDQFVARFGQEHTRSLMAGKDLGQLLLDRLRPISEREASTAEPQPAESNDAGVEEQQIARNSHRRRRRSPENISTGSIESYITRRYIASKSPLLRMLLLQPSFDPESSRREESWRRVYEQRSQLAIFEEVAGENPFLQELAKAVSVVSSVFKGFETKLNADKASMPHAFQFAEQLGPQLLRVIAELEKPSPRTFQKPDVVGGIKLALAQTEKKYAASVYQLIYSGQKEEFGAEAERTLATGHEYGCLCIQAKSFKSAEVVLREVWVRRQRILGPDDPQTLESAFQLGQVYFKTDRHEAALSLHETVYGLRRDVFGLQSVQTLQTAEVYGQVLMCRKSTDAQMQDGWVLLRQTLEIRMDMLGVNLETITSAFRLATISAVAGKFAESGEVFTWMFETGLDSLRSPGYPGSPGKLAAGLAAAGMAFLEKNDIKGNRLLKRVADYTADIYGSESPAIQSFGYIQAAILFLQGRGEKSRAILRRVFEMRKSSLGRKHPATKAAGIILAMEMFLDTLLSKGRIEQELDDINDWLLNFAAEDGEWTFPMRFCQTSAVIATMFELEGLSKAMLSWLYRTQKRRSGLFNRSTLGTLVLNRGLSLYTMFRRKSKKVPTMEGTVLDPRIFMGALWPAGIRVVANRLAGFNQMPFFAETLPNFLRGSTLWKSFEPIQFTAHFVSLFVPVYEELAPSDMGSRIWTIATDDSDTSTIGEMRGGENEGSGSIDFGDLDGRASEHLSSLGQSLLTLTLTHTSMSNFSELNEEIEMESLQNELVGEFVTDDGITAARGDIETLKTEMEGM